MNAQENCPACGSDAMRCGSEVLYDGKVTHQTVDCIARQRNTFQARVQQLEQAGTAVRELLVRGRLDWPHDDVHTPFFVIQKWDALMAKPQTK